MFSCYVSQYVFAANITEALNKTSGEDTRYELSVGQSVWSVFAFV